MTSKRRENEKPQKPVRDVAYRYLARRPHGRAELREKLMRRGYLDREVDALLEVLCSQGFVNDQETAYRWARSLVRERCWGSLKVSAYLLQKGIARVIIEAIQQELRQQWSEPEVAVRALEKKFPPCRPVPSRAKAARFLKARGFPTDVIYRVIGRYAGQEAASYDSEE